MKQESKCEIGTIYNPERISLNSLRDTYKNRWKGLNIHTIEITQGIRYFYITNHQHEKNYHKNYSMQSQNTVQNWKIKKENKFTKSLIKLYCLSFVTNDLRCVR